MILKKKYFTFCKISIISILILVSSIDYITRLALLILVFIKSGLKYIVLDFKFLGLTYIIVYVGAISILFLFVIKMTESGRSPNIVVSPKKKGKEKIKLTNTKKSGIRLDYIILSILLLTIIFNIPLDVSYENNNIYNYFIPSYSSEFVNFTDIEALGYIIYLGYPLIIVLIGILLWCVLIGILKISQS